MRITLIIDDTGTNETGKTTVSIGMEGGPSHGLKERPVPNAPRAEHLAYIAVDAIRRATPPKPHICPKCESKNVQVVPNFKCDDCGFTTEREEV